MTETNPGFFFYKKSFEIGYALLRVGQTVKRPSFGDYLERYALRLVELVSHEEYSKIDTTMKAAQHTIRLGVEMNLLNPASANVLLQEMDNFNASIAEFLNSPNLPDLKLESLFSPYDQIAGPRTLATANLVSEVSVSQGREVSEHQNGSGNGNGGMKAAMRQSAILERIRQNGNCRLKDIQEFLPDTSERTIRYDLQNLLERGGIERLGNGGPATFYRVK